MMSGEGVRQWAIIFVLAFWVFILLVGSWWIWHG